MPPADLAALIQKLEDPDIVERERAADALGDSGDIAAVEPLARALRDPSVVVRDCAARALGRLADAQAVDPLLAALERPAAGGAIERLYAAGDAIVRIGKSAVPVLGLTLMRDPDARRRVLAAEMLGQIATAEAIGPLARATADDDTEVRRAAAEALACFRDPRGSEALVDAMLDAADAERLAVLAGPARQAGHRDLLERLEATLDAGASTDRRRRAALALGALMHRDAAPALARGLADDDPGVVAACVRGLGRLGSLALEPVLGVLESEQARDRALTALAVIGDERAVPALEALAPGDGCSAVLARHLLAVFGAAELERSRLRVPVPAGWLLKSSLTILQEHGEANVIASTEPVAEHLELEGYADIQGDVLRKEFPDYRELVLREWQGFGGRQAVLRVFSWTPPDGNPVTQMQAYAVEPGTGITMTATTTNEKWPSFEGAFKAIFDSVLMGAR